MTTRKIKAATPPGEALGLKLLQSVREMKARARDLAWDALAAHRDAEIDTGAGAAVPGPEVLARLRAELE